MKWVPEEIGKKDQGSWDPSICDVLPPQRQKQAKSLLFHGLKKIPYSGIFPFISQLKSSTVFFIKSNHNNSILLDPCFAIAYSLFCNISLK
jgi:hypothetical protein